MKLNAYLVKAALAGALGGLLAGFDTAVIAGTTQGLSTTFGLSPAKLGFTVSIALWGTVLGASTAGLIGGRIGGRAALRIMACLYLLSALGCALAPSWPLLIMSRFLGGIGMGGSSVLGPVYIAEISIARMRGRLVGLFQLNIVLGILIAYFSNYALARINAGGLLWHWQFGIAAVPALGFLVLLFRIPLSSRWLVTKGENDKALEVLRKIGSEDPKGELREIVDSVQQGSTRAAESVFSRQYRYPVFLALSIGAFNQLSGVNAILYYLNDIFAAAGFSRDSSARQAIVIGVANLVATVTAMSLIDKIGRKTLLLIGSVGTAACLAGVATQFFHQTQSLLLLVYLIGFIFFFSASQGAVIWVFLSEIFPTSVRSKGQSIGSSAHWGSNALIAAVFPLVAARSHAFPFVCFAFMMVLQFFVVLRYYPETKGLTLEQLQRNLVAGGRE